MTRDTHAPDSVKQATAPEELRLHAEALVDSLPGAAGEPNSTEDVAAVLHELRVHQIELEMQNEELRSAHLDLDDQREKYYDLFDLAPVGYLTLSAQAIVGQANLTAAHLLGVERQMLVGQPFSAFVHTEDRDDFYAHQRALETTGEPQTCEFRLRRVALGGSDGGDHHFWAHLEGRPSRVNDGETACWMTVTDVDELRREEAALRESEERFRSLSALAPTGIYFTDPDGDCRYANPAWCKMAGLSPEEALGQGWIAGLHPDDREMVFSNWQHMVESGGEWGLEYRFQNRDGKVTWVYGLAAPQFDASGELVGYVGVNTDISARKYADRKTMEATTLLQAALDESPAGIAIADAPSGKLRYLNDAGLMMRGGDRASIVDGIGIDKYVESWQLLDLDGRPLQDAEVPLARAIMFGETNSRELMIRRGDGDDRLVIANAAPIKDENGETVAGIVVFSDITEMKQTEAALLESEEKFKYLWDRSVVAKSLTLPTGEAEMNDAFCQMLGYTREELANKTTWMQLTHPEDVAETQRQVDALLSGERTSARFEKRFIRKDGEIVWADLSTSLRRDASGEPMYFMTTVLDITERKRAESSLQQAGELQSAIFAAMQDGFSLLDAGGVHLSVNPALCEMTGFSADELVGVGPPHPYWPPEEIGTITRSFEATIRGEATEFELTFMRKDGERFPVLLTPAVLRDADGQVTSAFAIVRDVTERRQAEDALRASEATVQRKLNVILQPEGDIGALNLSDLIDQEALQTMMEQLYELTRLPSAVGDLEANILVAVGWQDICLNYHRVNPGTLANCHESDVVLAGNVPAGEFREYRCKNHLWDVVTPIYVGERHFGNIYLGQFTYDDEVIDYELFRSQARRYGFDETDYIAALDRVPRVSRKAVVAAIGVCSQLAQMISSLGYGKVQLSRSLAQKSAALAKYRTIAENISDVVWILDPLTLRFLYISPSVEKLRGYTPEEILAEPLDASATPEVSEFLRRINAERTEDLLSGREPPGRTYVEEVEQPCKDGSMVWTEIVTSYHLNEDTGAPEVHGVTRDISARKQAEEALRESLTSTIDVIGNVSEMRDPYTAGHQRRVAELAVAIEREMGMSPNEIADIRTAGLMHDVGKMSVPAEILAKPTKLTPIEFDLIKAHSEAGYEIISSAHMPGQIAELVLQHHERCDGSGYPSGLLGDALLEGAKVLAVADVAEAMMSHRPYRAGLGVDVALAEIERGAGRQYDPQVAEACVRVFRERGFEFSAA